MEKEEDEEEDDDDDDDDDNILQLQNSGTYKSLITK